MTKEAIENAIRDIKDFPKPGIVFKDITPLLHDGKLFSEYISILENRYRKLKPDYIVVIESRGFIFGSPLADRLKCGIVPIRKKGKLPHKTIEASYSLEYGTATVEIHQDALKKGDKIVLIDDLLATGGTAAASIQLVNKLDAEIVGIEFLIELEFLKGKEKISDYNVNSLITVD